LIIVDMQLGLFPVPRPGSAALIARIDGLAARLRSAGVPVIFVQHRGAAGDPLHPSQPGYAIHPGLRVDQGDVVIRKTFCDAFLDTPLLLTLRRLAVEGIIVAGCTTDFCVDTTVRSALAQQVPTLVAADGHTTFDRPYMSAAAIVEHHNAIWASLLSPVGPARLSRCDALG
jgi:nicotinamidase-related amidase